MLLIMITNLFGVEERKIPMDEIRTMFPRTKKAIEFVDDTYNDYDVYMMQDNVLEWDHNRDTVLDHPMLEIARAIYDDSPSQARDLYDYLGALIREEERNQKLRRS